MRLIPAIHKGDDIGKAIPYLKDKHKTTLKFYGLGFHKLLIGFMVETKIEPIDKTQ